MISAVKLKLMFTFEWLRRDIFRDSVEVRRTKPIRALRIRGLFHFLPQLHIIIRCERFWSRFLVAARRLRVRWRSSTGSRREHARVVVGARYHVRQTFTL